MLKLKNVKFIVLSIIFVLFLGITSCYAVDLDLSDDLISNSTNSNTNNSNVSSNNTNTNNDSSSNTNTSNTSVNNNTNSSYTNTNSSSTNSTPSATVTNSIPESDLGLSNILNIFLIVIGVLLIARLFPLTLGLFQGLYYACRKLSGT